MIEILPCFYAVDLLEYLYIYISSIAGGFARQKNPRGWGSVIHRRGTFFSRYSNEFSSFRHFKHDIPPISTWRYQASGKLAPKKGEWVFSLSDRRFFCLSMSFHCFFSHSHSCELSKQQNLGTGALLSHCKVPTLLLRMGEYLRTLELWSSGCAQFWSSNHSSKPAATVLQAIK